MTRGHPPYCTTLCGRKLSLPTAPRHARNPWFRRRLRCGAHPSTPYRMQDSVPRTAREVVDTSKPTIANDPPYHDHYHPLFGERRRYLSFAQYHIFQFPHDRRSLSTKAVTSMSGPKWRTGSVREPLPDGRFIWSWAPARYTLWTQ